MKFVLEELNEQQRAAVVAPDGPVMIVAGPGTGKTKTLAARIAWLLEQGVAPGDILALTFTHKAAGEMRARVDGLAAPAARRQSSGPHGAADVTPTDEMRVAGPEITTFHALGLRLLGTDARQFVGREERLEIIRGLKRPAELKGVSTRELALMLSNYKNRLAVDEGALGALAAAYTEALRARERRDFDDLLLETYEMVQEDPAGRPDLDPAAANAGARQWRYVLVDEFQDTNEVQYALAKRLVGAGGLFVIGDPRQSIYGFRGASGDVFERFAADFPTAQAVSLTINYRSGAGIVAAGNAVFKDGPQLTAASPAPGRVRIVETLSEYQEAAWIVSQIEAGVGGTGLLAAGASDEPAATSFRDFAVVYRTHRSAQALVRRLAESGLPYQIAGEGSPYERPEVAGVVSALGQLARGVGAEVTSMAEAAGEGLDTAEAWLVQEVQPMVGQARVVELVQAIADRIGGFDDPDKKGELAQLMSVLVRFGRDVGRAARYLEALREADYYDPVAEAVTLTTIHAAKGLEFWQVFVLGAEEGLLPHARPGMASDFDEEQRLFYVAVTRAKERLDLVHTRTRGGQKVAVSRFVRGLPAERLIDPDMAKQERKRTVARVKRAQGQLF